jgi:hypothetical protein
MTRREEVRRITAMATRLHRRWHRYELKRVGRGAIGAAINTAVNSIVLVIADPTTFNLFNGGAMKLAQVAVVSALLGAALYLKEHPPTWDDILNGGQ